MKHVDEQHPSNLPAGVDGANRAGDPTHGSGAGRPPGMETTRLEAFSDGVFAVAITLLALNLGVPATREIQQGHGLTVALLEQWPAYLGYALSFLTILIMWVNHHTLFHLIARTDHLFLLLNGLLLLVVTAMPFATALLATYLLQPERRVAMVVYSGLSLVMATAFNRMWAYASHGARLLDPEANPALVRGVTRAYRFGPLLYLIALALAFWSATASLTLCILLAIFFALPSTVTRMMDM